MATRDNKNVSLSCQSYDNILAYAIKKSLPKTQLRFLASKHRRLYGRRKFRREKFRRKKFRRISKSRNFVVLIRITEFTKRYHLNYTIT